MNAIVGDENAANSIGKSAALMAVDFALGGSDLIAKTNVIAGLGHHAYSWTMQFAGDQFSFRRSTNQPDIVERVDEHGNSIQLLSRQEYREWLRDAYDLNGAKITFRGCVSPFMRIWGRDALLDLSKPFQAALKESAAEAIDSLLKTFELYDSLDALKAESAAATKRTRTFNSAQRDQLIPSIGARDYRKFGDAVDQGREQLDDIRNNLAKFATNLGELLNEDVLRHKREKDILLKERLALRASVDRLEQDLKVARNPRRAEFGRLSEFFPGVDTKRLAEIEEFHRGLTSILRTEFNAELKELRGRLQSVDENLLDIDREITRLLRNVENPTAIVDHVVDVVTDLNNRERAMIAYDTKLRLKAEAAEAKRGYHAAKKESVDGLAQLINDEVGTMWRQHLHRKGAAPELAMSPTDYAYKVPSDTGTGTAYVAAVLLDLAIARLSQLPLVVHDLPMFKNIEHDTFGKLLDVYASLGEKQSFIAVDETGKFGSKTAVSLRESAVVFLTNAEPLYDLDWKSGP